MEQRPLCLSQVKTSYSSTILKHAKQLLTLLTSTKGSYRENIPGVATYFNSTGIGDEVLWLVERVVYVKQKQQRCL